MLDRNEIKNHLLIILNNLKNQPMQHSRFQALTLSDFSHSFPAIRSLLSLVSNSKIHDDALILYTKIFLNERWSRIKNTPLCYTVNTEDQINCLYRRLCTLVFGEETNELLMPTVIDEDEFGNTLNELPFGSFILTDNSEEFICIRTWIEHTITSMLTDGNLLFRTITKQGQLRTLSQNEQLKLARYCTRLKEIFDSLPRSCLLNELQELYRSLQNGDVRHTGQELEAGGCAYAGIANFFKYYNKLSDETRRQIANYRYNDITLGSLLNRLNRSHINDSGSGVSSCIKLLSTDLNFIIETNSDHMRNLNHADVLAVNFSKENLIEYTKRVDINLGKLQPLSPNRQLFPLMYSYTEYGNVGVPPELNRESANPYYRVYAILRIFICKELDRLISAPIIKTEKINDYLTVLFSIAKESFEFIDRPDNVKSVVLNEIYTRIATLSLYKATPKFKHLLFQSQSQSNLNELIKNNQQLFESVGIRLTLPSEKRKQMESILKNENKSSKLTLIESEEIAQSYAIGGV